MTRVQTRVTAKSPTAVAGFTQGETGGQWYWWTEADDELDIQILRTKTTKILVLDMTLNCPPVSFDASPVASGKTATVC